MGLGRFLNLDRLAGRFNQWIGATAVAAKAAPGDRRMAVDPSAVVGVLGEIESHYGKPTVQSEDGDLRPFNLETAKEARARSARRRDSARWRVSSARARADAPPRVTFLNTGAVGRQRASVSQSRTGLAVSASDAESVSSFKTSRSPQSVRNSA